MVRKRRRSLRIVRGCQLFGRGGTVVTFLAEAPFIVHVTFVVQVAPFRLDVFRAPVSVRHVGAAMVVDLLLCGLRDGFDPILWPLSPISCQLQLRRPPRPPRRPHCSTSSGITAMTTSYVLATAYEALQSFSVCLYIG